MPAGDPPRPNTNPLARRRDRVPPSALQLYEEFHPYGTSAYRAVGSGIEVSAKRYRYTGKERDEETGLDHMGARYYASWLGRWTAADPIGISGGLNLYGYAASNPVKFIDPSGHGPQLVTEQYTIPYEEPDQGPSDIVFEDEVVTGSAPGEEGLFYGQYQAVLNRTEGIAIERAPGALGAAEAVGTLAEGTIDAFTPRLESRPGDKIPNIIGIVQEGAEVVESKRQAAVALAKAQADIEIAEATGDMAAANEARRKRGRSGVFLGFGSALGRPQFFQLKAQSSSTLDVVCSIDSTISHICEESIAKSYEYSARHEGPAEGGGLRTAANVDRERPSTWP